MHWAKKNSGTKTNKSDYDTAIQEQQDSIKLYLKSAYNIAVIGRHIYKILNSQNTPHILFIVSIIFLNLNVYRLHNQCFPREQFG